MNNTENTPSLLKDLFDPTKLELKHKVGRPKKLTPEAENLILTLIEDYNQRSIARAFGVSAGTISNIKNRPKGDE